MLPEIKRRWLTLMVVALLVLVRPASGEEGKNNEPGDERLSLQDCIQTVLDKNSDLLIARDEIDAAVERKNQARSEFLFKATTSYSYTRLDETPEIENFDIPGAPNKIEIGSINNWSWKTEFSQPVFTGFAVVTAYELAKLGIDIAHVDLETTRLNLVLQTKVAYFNLLRAEKGTFVADDAVVGFEAQAKVAKDFFDVGMTPKNEYLKAEVEAANARQNLIRAQNLVEIRRTELNNLLRYPVDQNTRVEDLMIYSPASFTLEFAFEQAYQHRPELRAARLNTEATQKDVKLAQSEYYPSLAVTFGYERRGDTWKVDGSEFEDQEDWSLTAGLEWTLWEWGKTFHSVSENRVKVRQSEERERKLRELIALRVKEAYLNLRESEKNIPVSQTAIEQAEENRRMSVERYKEQVTTNTEVLDAQTLLSQAKDNYYDALYRYNIALAQLRVAMGLLD